MLSNCNMFGNVATNETFPQIVDVKTTRQSAVPKTNAIIVDVGNSTMPLTVNSFQLDDINNIFQSNYRNPYFQYQGKACASQQSRNDNDYYCHNGNISLRSPTYTPATHKFRSTEHTLTSLNYSLRTPTDHRSDYASEFNQAYNRFPLFPGTPHQTYNHLPLFPGTPHQGNFMNNSNNISDNIVQCQYNNSNINLGGYYSYENAFKLSTQVSSRRDQENKSFLHENVVVDNINYKYDNLSIEPRQQKKITPVDLENVTFRKPRVKYSEKSEPTTDRLQKPSWMNVKMASWKKRWLNDNCENAPSKKLKRSNTALVQYSNVADEVEDNMLIDVCSPVPTIHSLVLPDDDINKHEFNTESKGTLYEEDRNDSPKLIIDEGNDNE